MSGGAGDGDPPRFTGVCPVDGCQESFLDVSISTLRGHVVDAHGYLAVLDVPGLSLIPDESPSHRRYD
ncbi:hypothetical protein [Haloprofundus halobius]|uniref:hypothetical protein n=1 Tax=Haloprofundus halobius TaxID=2876194 RepID=UPI001CCF08D9|nr:hypothetical protein [Haloprofundus halobius]